MTTASGGSLVHADAALFDLGGVLISDPWESILLAPDGLASRLDLNRHSVQLVAAELWKRYCLRETAEEDYWSELGERLGVQIDLELVHALERDLLVVNPHADEVLGALAEHGVRIGVITDNTSFWFPKQVALLDLDRYVDPGLVFVSFRFGVNKSQSDGGLFEFAAHAVDPGTAVVIDDRANNLAQASRRGFEARHYSMTGSDEELTALLSLQGHDRRQLVESDERNETHR